MATLFMSLSLLYCDCFVATVNTMEIIFVSTKARTDIGQ